MPENMEIRKNILMPAINLRSNSSTETIPFSINSSDILTTAARFFAELTAKYRETVIRFFTKLTAKYRKKAIRFSRKFPRPSPPESREFTAD